ncbi:MAG TPA: GAF domain-containing sensor histidine kinase [Acidimicrobiales bacterium]|nr:GAF domain-containing sensor histidine kinase [Acidimicrobiales bacterium]
MADVGDALSAVSDAVLGIAGDLSIDVVLERLVHAAQELAGARYAALGVPDDEHGFARFITAGMSEAEIEALGPLPRTHGLLGAMLTDPTPYRTPDIRADPRFRGWWPAAHPVMRSFLGVPIVFRGDVIGAFYLTDKRGEPVFTAADEEVVGVLAAHAAVLMEHARLYEQSRELSILAERNRLARELHDAMTQTLFSLRLSMEAAAALVDGDAKAAAVELDTGRTLIDAAFGELRALILELRPPAVEADGLVTALRKHLDVVGRAHGLAVSVAVAGDPAGADALAPEQERALFRIAQEAVTNAVRHAAASTIEVVVAFDVGGASVAICDDGAGFDPAARSVHSRRLGLTSMRERAQELGGQVRITSAPGQGTTVRAEVPVAGR